MGKPISKALGELKRALIEIHALTWILDALVVFLVFELIFFLTTIPWYYSFAPTGL